MLRKLTTVMLMLALIFGAIVSVPMLTEAADIEPIKVQCCVDIAPHHNGSSSMCSNGFHSFVHHDVLPSGHSRQRCVRCGFIIILGPF